MTSLGTTYKLAVSVSGLEPESMDTVPFSCRFWTWNGGVTLRKDEMVRLSANSYVAVVDSALLGRGTIKVETTVQIPDGDCPGGYRTEVYREDTGIRIE